MILFFSRMYHEEINAQDVIDEFLIQLLVTQERLLEKASGISVSRLLGQFVENEESLFFGNRLRRNELLFLENGKSTLW